MRAVKRRYDGEATAVATIRKPRRRHVTHRSARELRGDTWASLHNGIGNYSIEAIALAFGWTYECVRSAIREAEARARAEAASEDR